MSRESNFQNTALSYLNSLPGCVAENVSGNAKQSGRPDINGCYKGRMFKLELKTPEHRYQASKKQKLNLRRWKRAGCVVGVIYSMEALEEVFSVLEITQGRIQGGTYYVHEENNCESWYSL